MSVDPEADEPRLLDTVDSVLTEHLVSVGILFGSRARGGAHGASDVDVAVVLTDLEPGDPGYNDAFLGLSADLAAALGTDDVDLVDLRRAPDALVRTVIEEGTILVGSEHDVRAL